MGTKRKQCMVYLNDKSLEAINHYQSTWNRSRSEICNIALGILLDLWKGDFKTLSDPQMVFISNYAFRNIKEVKNESS